MIEIKIIPKEILFGKTANVLRVSVSTYELNKRALINVLLLNRTVTMREYPRTVDVIEDGKIVGFRTEIQHQPEVHNEEIYGQTVQLPDVVFKDWGTNDKVVTDWVMQNYQLQEDMERNRNDD